MKSLVRRTSKWGFVGIIFISWFVIFSAPMEGQNNSVYDSTGTTTVAGGPGLRAGWIRLWVPHSFAFFAKGWEGSAGTPWPCDRAPERSS
jgi:hypothetical protein